MTPFWFIDVNSRLHIKHNEERCGDVLLVERRKDSTVIVLCDGLGSGSQAHMAAAFAGARLVELINQGMSSREALGRLVKSMQAAKEKKLPYAAITLCTILADGQTTVLAYEMPSPIALDDRYAYLPSKRTITLRGGTVCEYHFYCKNDHDVILVSDGVSQAGLGKIRPMGWQEEGIARFINKSFQLGATKEQLIDIITREILILDDQKFLDDSAIVHLRARHGNTVTLLSGPPAEKSRDREIVEEFIRNQGIKIICGASTAAMAAAALQQPLTMDEQPAGYLEPPKYKLPGIDITTEGAVTLNQVYNICDQPLDEYALSRDPSAVITISSLLQYADRIQLFVGTAENPAHENIKFMQIGIVPRLRIIPRLVEKLKKMGKLVIVTYF